MSRARRPSPGVPSVSLLLLGILLGLFLGLPAPPPTGAASPPPFARLPLEVLATGFRDLQGLVWGPDQALYASDRAAGVVYRIAPSATGTAHVTVRQAGVHHPMGLAVAPDGALLVVEAGGGREPFDGRVLRLNGIPTPVWTGLRQPAWLTVTAEGTLYVTAAGWREAAGRSGGGWGSAAALLLRHVPTAPGPQVVATDLWEPGGLVAEPDGHLLLSVERLRHQGEWRGPTLVRVDPTRPAGDRRLLSVVLGAGFLNPAGLAVDAVGGILFGAQSYAWLREADLHWREGRDLLRGALFRLRPGGAPTALVAGLPDLRALAVDPQGHLYLATDEALYRLRAPAPPTLEAGPPFTNQPTSPVRGVATPGAAITLVDAGAPVVIPADPTTGAFEGTLPLTANREHLVRVYATSLGGAGLPSAPAEWSVVTDTRPPVVRVTRPAPGAIVRGAVTLAAAAVETMEAGEAWSGVASLQVAVGAPGGTTAGNPTPESPLPFVIAAAWDTTTGPDGPVSLVARGTDRAGNAASDTVTVTVDNTPPMVAFGQPAPGAVVQGAVEVTVAASDATTGVASVALFLDGALRASGPGPLLTATLPLGGLAAGAHTLTATATDQAGNSATTHRTILVQALTLQITTPAAGATIVGDRVLVQGTVSGAAEVGVVVNGVGAFLQGAAFTAWVPVAVGPQTLTVTANTPSGDRVTQSLQITVSAPPEEVLRLTAAPGGGPAPLTVRFVVSGMATPAAGASPGPGCILPGVCPIGPGGDPGVPTGSVEVDYDGNGSVDYTGSTLDGQQFTYTSPGIYVPQVRVTDSQGNVRVASTVVEVYDPAALTSLLQTRWTGMREALATGNIEAALGAFVESVRDSYRTSFTALAEVGALPQLAQDLSGIRLVRIADKYAEYELRANWNGVEYSYFVLFEIDAEGLWRLRAF